MSDCPMTLFGKKMLEGELHQLIRVEREEIKQAISDARELGDLKENAEYAAAKERQSIIEGRIMDLEDKFSRAEIIDPTKVKGANIKFGAVIVLFDNDTENKIKLQIVGEYEADLSKGMVSLNSPIARASIGKEVGDSIEVTTPAGIKTYEIDEIIYE